MAKNTIELKGKSASAFFKAAVQSIKPNSERLEAAGFKNEGVTNGRLFYCLEDNGEGLRKISLDVAIGQDCFEVYLNVDDYSRNLGKMSVDEVLTLVKLLGLSPEVKDEQ